MNDTNINLNPHSAAYRAAMKGWPAFHYCTYGERLIAFNCLGLRLDLYKGSGWFGYARIRNAATVFTPIGSITWPMPDLHPTE
jgi:hypothetical protein